MQKQKLLISTLILALFASLIPLSSVLAIDFDQTNIISNSDLTNHKTMSVADIQSFLDRKSGVLKNLETEDCNGEVLTAAEIIYNAAHEYEINPQFLLVMLQKEQSVVEDPSPSQKQLDWAMGYAICDSCEMDDPDLIKYKGFGNQVDYAAGSNRWYIKNTDNGWLKTPGETYTIDGKEIKIANQATANLYNYTPHVHGNYVFWKVWNSWFSQLYPDGTILQVEGEDGVWILAGGKRRAFHSRIAFLSRYRDDQVVNVSKTELEKYEEGLPIRFANYSILQAPDKSVYLLVDDKLRMFESSEVVRTLGFNPEEFEDITYNVFQEYEQGEPITIESSYPAGALLQDNTTGGVFFVQEGKKYPVLTRDILKVNYPNYKITPVTPDELEKYERLAPAKFKDGELVRSYKYPTVFFISNGFKLPILSADVYESLGFKWENIRWVEEKSLSNLIWGNALELDFKN